jgi:hypothetical protein
MNLESLALLGEFVGGLAVLITIGYLAYQTRQTRSLLEQSTRQQTASMLRANIDGWNHMWATILDDQESIDLYYRMRCGEALEGPERQRAELLAFMFFLNLDNFILQNQMTPFVEEVEPVVRGAVEHHVREILSSPALRQWWQREQICFSQQFREAVESARG